MTEITGDITRFAQIIFCIALENAKSALSAERRAAYRWLTSEDNHLRDLILEAVSPEIHQDWIDDYVRECKEEFDE